MYTAQSTPRIIIIKPARHKHEIEKKTYFPPSHARVPSLITYPTLGVLPRSAPPPRLYSLLYPPVTARRHTRALVPFYISHFPSCFRLGTFQRWVLLRTYVILMPPLKFHDFDFCPRLRSCPKTLSLLNSSLTCVVCAYVCEAIIMICYVQRIFCVNERTNEREIFPLSLRRDDSESKKKLLLCIIMRGADPVNDDDDVCVNAFLQ